MKKYSIVHVFILLGLMTTSEVLNAQFNETIRTGRPGQAIGPFSVGKYVFQTQTGLDYGVSKLVDGDETHLNYVPNTVLRFGLTKHFELQSLIEYTDLKTEKNDSSFHAKGISAGNLGMRIHLYDAKNLIPAIGLQVSLKIPNLSADFPQNALAPKILIITNSQLNQKLNFIFNFGVDYNGLDIDPRGIYVANLGYSLNTKWACFLENYGHFTKTRFENRWDAGFAYLYNDNLQLDLYGGIGKNNGMNDYFTSLGISWRTLTLRKKLLQNNNN